MDVALFRRFAPAPDSAVADALRCGKSPWHDAVHLLWSAWLFITPMFGSGYDWTWAGFTLLSYPVFLGLYAGALLASRRSAWRYAIGMVLLCFALLRWYPSGLSYFVFGCVMLHVGTRVALWKYLVQVLALNGALALLATWIGYPWQVLAWMLPMTLVIGIIVNVERSNEVRDAALRLSQEEVRRLAATAERERIGRDLHDLLGHTLSLITLKLELSRKLLDRDAAAARLEIAEAEKVARHALAEVRSAVTGFRAADLAAELAAARLLLESSGVALEYAPPPALPGELERPLALVLREAATNIARHAGASRAEVIFEATEACLCMRIVDNGRGGVAAHGNGLSGMAERVRALRGQLQVQSPPRGGTCVEVQVPLGASAPATVAAVEPPAPVAALERPA
ncbi:sensor histidine kinase [Cognatiluteimonas weifangensis]|uniref:Sensor histidine kinase n=1 Tax=Cognatiluteimonas weifangensis TaxID=2303539 RepID=A0A372DHX7_9GAMM|nr:sensor histidine kinase [Luteimonas weifangensis]RFP59181.1 sensor histidine kinase [Luteimonas weifangensis]